MTPTALAADALASRRAAATAHPDAPPSGTARRQPFGSQLRAQTTERDGKSFVVLEGHASSTESPYEMWDFWGPFTEVISAGAFAPTLAKNPDVAFLVNHTGLTMARTTAGTLELSEDEVGLFQRAWLNPQRQDVQDLVHALDDGAVDQMSFAFRIVRGHWSPDYTEYRIDEVDLDRGDVSAVNYGANPNTNISARARQAFEAIEHLEGAALLAAHERLAARVAAAAPTPGSAATPARTAPQQGASTSLLRARLDLDA